MAQSYSCCFRGEADDGMIPNYNWDCKPISGHVQCGDIIQACHVLHIYYALIVIVHIKSEREKIIFSNFIVLYCAGNSLENCTRCESE